MSLASILGIKYNTFWSEAKICVFAGPLVLGHAVWSYSRKLKNSIAAMDTYDDLINLSNK